MNFFDAAVFLEHLSTRGVMFVRDGVRLRFSPASALTPDAADGVRLHKPAIMDLIASAGNGHMSAASLAVLARARAIFSSPPSKTSALAFGECSTSLSAVDEAHNTPGGHA